MFMWMIRLKCRIGWHTLNTQFPGAWCARCVWCAKDTHKPQAGGES